ncbi:MAG: SDR family oxidoreductase [Muribaculaceae bacterium]|nr:SDR family oxidoreductase [Muribaculaceae bacterium]
MKKIDVGKLAGKRVVIVGASSGIGLRVAEIMAAGGIHVGLAARHTERLAELSRRYPGMVEYVAMDITDEDATAALSDLISALGGMDIYIHVAGIGYSNNGLDPQAEDEVVDTNAAGFARMLAAAYGYFRDHRRSGRIAALTSVAGTKGIGRMAAYSASKRCAWTYIVALRQLAREQHVDVAFTDIRPGWIKTPLLSDGTPHALEMTLDHAVPLIVRAIIRRRRVAVVDWRWRVVVALWRCVPDWLWVRMSPGISI